MVCVLCTHHPLLHSCQHTQAGECSQHFVQTLGKELRAVVLGGSCVWWCEKQRCMGSNGHGLVEILPVSLD